MEKEKMEISQDSKLMSKIVECVVMYTASLYYGCKDDVDVYKAITDEADGLYKKVDRDVRASYGERERVILNELRNKDLQNFSVKELIELVEKRFG